MKNTFLSKWSAKVDEVDKDILKLLARRKTISECIGRIKVLKGLKIYDGKRENAIVYEMQRYAKELGLNKNIATSLMVLLMNFNKEVLDKVVHSLNKSSFEKTIQRKELTNVQ